MYQKNVSPLKHEIKITFEEWLEKKVGEISNHDFIFDALKNVPKLEQEKIFNMIKSAFLGCDLNVEEIGNIDPLIESSYLKVQESLERMKDPLKIKILSNKIMLRRKIQEKWRPLYCRALKRTTTS